MDMNNKISLKLPDLYVCKVAIIGLGYVGLPLAVLISQRYKCSSTKREIRREVIGFDINKERIDELNKNFDRTLEVNQEELKSLKNIIFVDDINRLIDADVFIITVPTPVDKNNTPDLSFTINASNKVGELLLRRK